MLRLAPLAMVALAAWGRTTAIPTDASNGAIVAQLLGVAANRPTADDLHRKSALGLRYVQTDVSWATTERKQGVYDFSHAIVIAQQARANGLRPIVILGYVWRNDGNDSTNDHTISAYCSLMHAPGLPILACRH